MPTTHHLGDVLRHLIAYRQWRSPEALDRSYRPDRAPVGAATIRRIINGEKQPDDEELARLAGMLRLPLPTLRMVRDGDLAGVERLEGWRDGDESVRQFILDAMRPAPVAKKVRRAR